jgi:hypothetical protein
MLTSGMEKPQSTQRIFEVEDAEKSEIGNQMI